MAMSEALEKIKAELMLLGFISLLITVGTKPVSKICISAKAGSTMLPCKEPKDKEDYNNGGNDGDDRRKLLWHTGKVIRHRILAAGGEEDYCTKHGKVPLVSQSGIHQLHIFIFMLAVFLVLYSVLTIGLAKAKMKKWKGWELETSSLEYQFTNDPSRFRLAHQTSFVRRHTGFFTAPGLRWIAHLAPNSKFNFHKYIKRSMEDDFKVVVGIRMIFLIVGAKLEIIIMEMAQQIQDRGTVVKGAPVVEPSNSFFWFNCPDLILFLLHFTLFQYEFGLKSCFHKNLMEVLIRVFLGVALQILCSYITFPLYALVTQMGSHMKKAIFEEQTAMALKKWQKAARERKKLTKATGIDIPSSFIREENNTPSHGLIALTVPP
ncbi:MLO protein homolog 1-like [Pistacia vera]|uniref:MLO protein homolog 1-like n=1 Tax=Pistacia vera TaxID=55513 RepID=UPI0012636C1B|nr:MLO protein homolog 1-like [Pistacia vera]